MAEKIRYTRKDLKGPDEFISTFGRTVAWIRRNRLRAGIGIGAVVLVVCGAFGVRAWFAWQEQKATRDLWPHLNRAREFLQTPGSADAQKLAALEQFLAAHVAMHPDTRAAMYARYYLGSIAYQRGDYDAAAAQFRSAIAAGGAKGMLAFLFKDGLAQALEAKRDYAGAARMYREAAEAATPAMKTLALAGEARTLELQGKTREAAEAYRALLAADPPARLKEFVEIKLRRLG